MLRFSALALLVLLLFGLIFALLPSAPSVRDSGVKLEGVQLRLYPAQDPKAEWRFAAGQISVDPEKGQTALDQLGQGSRWVRNASGGLTEDMRIKASNLVIDNQDNLHAKQAELYTLADCSTLTLSSLGQQEVIINQQGGYTAPRAEIVATIISGKFKDVRSNFDFSNFTFDTQEIGATFRSLATKRCVNGKLEPKLPL